MFLFSLVVLGVFLVTVGAVGSSLWAFREIAATSDQEKHTYTVINRANVLSSELKDAETGQRGYTLKGNETFLEPYFLVRDNVYGHLNQLRQLTLSREAQKHLDTLTPLVGAKLEEIAQTIDLRRHQNITAVIAAISNGDGKRLMDSIRAEMNGLMSQDIDNALEAGFFLYITKPVKVNELMKAIIDALDSSKVGLLNTNKTG